MATRRIFISSVIGGFGEERQAAKSAVALLRHHPVMAEDFGAKPQSPQSACLNGVATSSIYVGIYGKRYGYVASSSGLSATEEEFQEARQRGIPILLFVSQEEKDDDQKQFLERVMGYEVGFTRASYDSPSDLKDKIVQAINDLAGDPHVKTLDSTNAASHLSNHQWGAFRPPQYGVSLGLVVFPERQGDEYFPLRELASKNVQDLLLKDAMFSSPALLSREVGVQTEDGQDNVEFFQSADRFSERKRRISVHVDGTITFGCVLGDEGRQAHFNIVRSFIIDQREVRQCIEMFLSYAAQVYSRTERHELISRVYFGGSLSGIRDKGFGIIPEPAPNGLGMPGHNLSDPLQFPFHPLAIPRAALIDPTTVSADVTELIRRTFKAAKAEYDPKAYNRW